MPSSGDAHIDFTEEVTPDKGSLNKLAKTFIPFILLFLTKAGYLSWSTSYKTELVRFSKPFQNVPTSGRQ